MLITVFTPAYNRAHLLLRLYESLCRQTFRDFEWVIVDDGSTDGTKQLFQLNDNLNERSTSGRLFRDIGLKNVNWAAQEKKVPVSVNVNVDFPIRYFYQENGGKHRAINRGVKEAKGELFFIVDSDDLLTFDSLEMVAYEYDVVKNDKSFCGVSGMKGYSLAQKVGSQKSFGYLDCTIMESSYRYHIYGDKAEIIRTEIMKKYPFPEFENEKFCPEALIWNRISQYYKIHYFDKIIYLCEYLPDGLTSKISKLLEKNPCATMLTYKEMNEYEGVSLWYRVRSAINYYRYTLLSSFRYDAVFKLKNRWIWTLPLGLVIRFIKG